MNKKLRSNVKNILVVNSNNQIGDVLSTLPMYAKLKDKFPLSKITFVAALTNYPIPLFDINPYIDEVITYDKSSLNSIINFYKKLRKKKYQIGVVQSTIKLSRTSHIINFLSGAKIRAGVSSIDGEKNNSSYLLNVEKDFQWKNKDQTVRSLGLVDQLFQSKEAVSDNKYYDSIKINFTSEDEEAAQDFLKDLKVFPEYLIGIHPGAGKKENTWSSENFIELLQKINEKKKVSVVITSGTIDDEIVKKISEELKKLNISFLAARNFEIKKLAALISCLDLYITNDTGPMHIAGTTDVKQISLFGPTNSNEWGPKGENKISIQSSSKNINDITVDDVLKKIEIL